MKFVTQPVYTEVVSRSWVHFVERSGKGSFWGRREKLVVSDCMLAIALRVCVLTISINILKC